MKKRWKTWHKTKYV